MQRRNGTALLSAILTALLTAGCAPGLHVVHTVAVIDIPMTEPRNYSDRCKVQMADGSIVMFPRGISITESRLTGSGTRFGLDGTVNAVGSVPLDSVLAAQSFVTQVHAGKTAALSGLSTIISTAAVLAGCSDCEEGSYDRSGARARDLPYAAAPVGASVVVELAEAHGLQCDNCDSGVRGELLSVDDTMLLVLRSHSDLVEVPRSAVRRLQLEGLGTVDLNAPEGRRRARLVSRFPGGISSQVREQLEVIYSQRTGVL
jgi:hypothetical protein